MASLALQAALPLSGPLHLPCQKNCTVKPPSCPFPLPKLTLARPKKCTVARCAPLNTNGGLYTAFSEEDRANRSSSEWEASDDEGEEEPSPRGWRTEQVDSPDPQQLQFVSWFRGAWPYIQGHRGSTFVVVIPGEVAGSPQILENVLQDISLLHGLGTRILLVTGAHFQIDQLLRRKGIEPTFVGPYRVTDEETLYVAMEAAGRIRMDIEAKLSRGPSIPVLRRHGENDRWHDVGVSVASGNYVAAKRRGVVDGVDFGYTGEVKKVDVGRIKERLNSGCIVMLSNLGYSAAGEVLNCNAYEVATAAAIALKADKMLCLLDGSVTDDNGRFLRWMTLHEADALVHGRAESSGAAGDNYVELLRAGNGNGHSLSEQESTNGNGAAMEPRGGRRARGFAVGGKHYSTDNSYLAELAGAVYACKGGVRRVHLMDATIPGSLLLELYTRDGIGTMVSSDLYEGTRTAQPRDLQGIMALLKPLEDAAVLVHRPAEQLMRELPCFTVVERDGAVIACAALFPFHNERIGEVAAFAVSPECRGHGRGDNLLDYLEKKAVESGLDRLFLLTTRTADWFVQRGFTAASEQVVPGHRRAKINPDRHSKVFMKELREMPASQGASFSGGVLQSNGAAGLVFAG